MIISQSFKGNKKNTFEYMHPSTPLPKSAAQAAGNATVCVHADLALGSEQGAGTECTHHVQWTMKAC